MHEYRRARVLAPPVPVATRSTRGQEASAAQALLELQRRAGNAAVTTLLHAHPATPTPPAGIPTPPSPAPQLLPVQRAGDKIAFEPASSPGDVQLTDEENAQLATLREIIETARTEKRRRKADIEHTKEEQIREIDDKTLHESKRIPELKKRLKTYHSSIEASSGWRWSQIYTTIRSRLGEGVTFDNLPTGSTDASRPNTPSLKVTVKSSRGTPLLYVHFGDSRFGSPPPTGSQQSGVSRPGGTSISTSSGSANVHYKHGYFESSEFWDRELSARPTGNDAVPERKQFILDDNNVYTRRFVTRAITLYHLANMVGLRIQPPEGFESMDDSALSTAEPKVEQLIVNQQQLFAQLPRYMKGTFGPHADDFDINTVAAIAGSPQSAKYDQDQIRTGRETGFKITSGPRKTTATPSSTMDVNEMASMQVRNGSGSGQPFLSTTSTQPPLLPNQPPKVIRGNKGERFDEGAENQAVCKIDLAKAKALGVRIVNQHSEESHKFKTAYDRYFPVDDLMKLAKLAATKFTDDMQILADSEGSDRTSGDGRQP